MIREERISFTWHERRRLSAALRGVRDARQHRRLMAVWLVAQGQSPGETAGLLGCSYRWVNKCLARYLERRCAQDLAERPRAGRPRTSAVLTPERLRDVVQSDPFLWGYNSTTWTVPLLATHLTAAPQVVEWFPRTSSWNARENFSDDTHFLVIQPLSFSRPRQHDYDLAVISEFHVVHKGKTHFEPPTQEAKQKLDSNEITIIFLGYRNFKLTPLK